MAQQNGPMGTSDLIKSVVGGSGSESVAEDVLGPTGSQGVSYTDEEGQIFAGGGEEDDLMSRLGGNDSEDAPADSSEETSEEEANSEQSKAPEKTSESKEVITVTDEKGKKKITIDYSDKAKIRKAYEMAYGARKWQADRDAARNQAKELQGKVAELEGNFQTLEQIRNSRGIEGLIDVLEGRQGAYKEWLQKQIDRHEYLKKASPEEVELLNAREREESRDRELAKLRQELEDRDKKWQEAEERTELRALESRVHPVFDKYRFAGKLGSEDDEHVFDEMLWNSALKRLEPYEEQGLDLSPALIEREFRSVFNVLNKRMSAQAEKRASRAVAQKKQEATENVQSKVMSGYKQGGTAKEAIDMMNSGNLRGLLQNWGKYSKVFNPK